jgi:hypothetical protein
MVEQETMKHMSMDEIAAFAIKTGRLKVLSHGL